MGGLDFGFYLFLQFLSSLFSFSCAESLFFESATKFYVDNTFDFLLEEQVKPIKLWFFDILGSNPRYGLKSALM